MFFDVHRQDECKKHTHNAEYSFVFPPPKIGVLFALHQSVYDNFHFNSTFTTNKAQQERLGALKSESSSICLSSLKRKCRATTVQHFLIVSTVTADRFLFSLSTQGFVYFI